MTFKLAMQTIRQHIEESRRYLVIELISGKAEVMKRDDIFQRPGGPGLMQIAMIDIAEIVERFDRQAPRREEFTLTEVAAMALQNGPTVHSWIKAGVLTPSIRDRNGTRGRAMLFSRRDAFVACLVASLKRQCGLPLSKLRQVSEVFSPWGEEAGLPESPKETGGKKSSKKKHKPKAISEKAVR